MKQKKLAKDKIRDDVIALLGQGRFKIDDRFLSERDLAERHGVTQLTVREALKALESDGYLERVPRTGSFVRRLPTMKDFADNRLVAVLMRTEGDFYTDLWNFLSKELQNSSYVPIVISPPEPTNLVGAVKQIGKIMEMGCRRLIVQDDVHFYFEPVASELGVLKGDDRWRQIIWLLGYDNMPSNVMGDVVGIDYPDFVDDVIRYLKSLGRERITFLVNNIVENHPIPEHHYLMTNTYCAAMTAHGLSANISILEQPSYRKKPTSEEKKKDIRALLSRPDRPTAIFAAGDYRLVEVVEVAQEMNLSIPDDLALVGVTDSPWAEHYNLSSVNQRPSELAKKTVDLLNSEHICGQNRIIVKQKAELTIRNSTKIQS